MNVTVIAVGRAANPVLSALLDEELSAAPTTRRGFTNHLPMALVAKERLGASDVELARFARAYVTWSVPLPEPTTTLDARTWTSRIGERAAAADLRDYFARAVLDADVDDVVRSHLGALLPGLGGAGFHGVIRLSYALEVASPARALR